MAQLPQQGQPNWGPVLNQWLLQSHDDNGQVTAVQGVPVMPVAPKHGQVMVYDAKLGAWAPSNSNAFNHAMVVNAIIN